MTIRNITVSIKDCKWFKLNGNNPTSNDSLPMPPAAALFESRRRADCGEGWGWCQEMAGIRDCEQGWTQGPASSPAAATLFHTHTVAQASAVPPGFHTGWAPWRDKYNYLFPGPPPPPAWKSMRGSINRRTAPNKYTHFKASLNLWATNSCLLACCRGWSQLNANYPSVCVTCIHHWVAYTVLCQLCCFWKPLLEIY